MELMKVIAEQEHYLLVADGARFTVVERRAGKFYLICNGIRHSFSLDDESLANLLCCSSWSSEREGRRALADVADRWRDLLEHIR